MERNIVSGVEQAILKLFDDFSYKYHWSKECGNNIHYYNGWRTNKAHMINKKIILPINGFSSWTWDKKDKLETYQIADKFKDMVKVFDYLAGEVDNISNLVNISLKLANDNTKFNDIDLHYFKVTFYKKGTCHITFLDEKLLKKFNIFGSQRKGWLPPSYGKSRYEDMASDERTTIDEFEGKDSYKQTLNNKDYYLVDNKKFYLGSGLSS